MQLVYLFCSKWIYKFKLVKSHLVHIYVFIHPAKILFLTVIYIDDFEMLKI